MHPTRLPELAPEQATRGYSRDTRSDCKQVCIALVMNRCGMPLAYELFAGNKADVPSLAAHGAVSKLWPRSAPAAPTPRGPVGTPKQSPSVSPLPPAPAFHRIPA